MDRTDDSIVCCPRHPGVRKLTREFLRQSTLHGVKYLGAPNRHIIERIFWAFAVLAAFGVSVYLVNEVYTTYKEKPVIISFQPMETSVARVPFPAITICNVNILKGPSIKREWDLVEELERAGKNPFEDEMIQECAVKLEQVDHYCSAAPSFRRMVYQPVHNLNGDTDFAGALKYFFTVMVNDSSTKHLDRWKQKYKDETKEFFEKASHDCEDMILKCMWARTEINCSEFFFNIKTRNGQCCVFNMMPEYHLRKMDENDTRAVYEKEGLPDAAEDEWGKFNIEEMVGEPKDRRKRSYPKYQMAGGKQYGLSLIVNPELSLYSSCTTNDAWGLKVQMVAHSPLSFPSIVDYGMPITVGHEIFVDIEPQLTVTNRGDISSIPVRKRGCLLPTDKDANLEIYNYYTSTNCMDECIAKFTQKECSCVRYYMPRNSSQALCGAKKHKCAEQVLENITSSGKYKNCPKCWPACTDIKYRMQLSQFSLRENATKFNYVVNGKNLTASNYSILHIYIGSSSLYAKERKALVGAADFLANAGGLLSFTLGFSIISLVEIIYYCTLRPFFQFILPGKQDSDGEEEEEEEEGDYFGKLSQCNDGVFRTSSKTEYHNWMKDRLGGDQVVTRRINVTQGQDHHGKSKQLETPGVQLFGAINSHNFY